MLVRPIPIDSTLPASTEFDLTQMDHARVWMVYAAFGGDVEKTSIAAQVPHAAVVALAHDYHWAAKLKHLKTGAGKDDAERTANRAVNYIQAQRMRNVLERSIALLEDQEGLVRAIVAVKLTREGEIDSVTVNPKAILELTKALEVVQNMSYRALGDKIPAQAEGVDGKPAGTQGQVQTVRDVIGVLADIQMRSSADRLPDETELGRAMLEVTPVVPEAQ